MEKSSYRKFFWLFFSTDKLIKFLKINLLLPFICVWLIVSVNTYAGEIKEIENQNTQQQ